MKKSYKKDGESLGSLEQLELYLVDLPRMNRTLELQDSLVCTQKLTEKSWLSLLR
jgi:hypothetical protein